MWEIFVKDIDGNYTTLQANENTTVRQLKEKYAKK
jgi:hypothetical protein